MDYKSNNFSWNVIISYINVVIAWYIYKKNKNKTIEIAIENVESLSSSAIFSLTYTV